MTMKTLTAKEILALKPGALIRSTDKLITGTWLVIQPLTGLDDHVCEALQQMWDTEFNFFTIEEMAESGMVRIA